MSNRRQFIKDLSVGSAAIAIGLGAKDDLLAFEPDAVATGPFMTNGIKIGEVTSSEAIIWTRLTKDAERVGDDAPHPVILYKNDNTGEFGPKPPGDSRPDLIPKVLYKDGTDIHTIAGAVPAAAGEVRVLWKEVKSTKWNALPWVQADPGNDATRQFRLSGLKPATAYDIKAESRAGANASVSATVTGRLRTAPPADKAADIKFMIITCQEYHHRDYGSKGFKLYEAMLQQNPDFMVHTGDVVYYDQQAKNLDLARWHWQRLYSFPTLVEFHRQVPSYFMKDDHDTWMNDCWDGKQTRFMGEFTFRQGQQVFLDQVPMGEKTYRTVRWGKDLQVWMMEGRDFRTSNDMPDGPDKTIWGKEQIAWFKKTVEASDATFKVLVSATPFVGPDRSTKDDNHANKGFYHEGEMLRLFAAKHKMYIVNGDRHWQYASKDPETGLLEFGCGPVSNEHAGGWKPGDFRPEHLYMNIIGGYLEVKVVHKGSRPEIVFTHRGVDGNLLFEHKPEV